jgi:hypothetical protein
MIINNNKNLMWIDFFSSFLGVLAGIILLGTLVEVWQEANPYREFLPTSKAPESTFVRILKCFSIYGNGKRILNTDPPKGGSTFLGCLSGIRFISF